MRIKKSIIALLKFLFKGNQLIYLEYPANGQAKYFAPNGISIFEKLLSQHNNSLIKFVALLESQLEDLKKISFIKNDEKSPFWKNETLSALDGASLYTIVRHYSPRKVIEIGSGNSTKFMYQAAKDNHGTGRNATKITSIDPNPRAYVDEICDTVLRTTLEAIDVGIFEELVDGDFIFFDGSHRCFQNNDVSVFFLEILPKLKKGILVGIHDIWLPYDYPPDWEQRFYSEQIVLGAYWIGKGADLEIVASNMYASKSKDLRNQYQAFLDQLGINASDQYRDGGLFLIRT
jgi:hypothetical protein